MYKEYVLYDYFSKKTKVINVKDIIIHKLFRWQFSYNIISPTEKNIAVIGDVSKNITGSKTLIKDIKIKNKILTINGIYQDDIAS